MFPNFSTWYYLHILEYGLKKKLSKYLPFYQYSLAHTFMTFQLGSEKISPHSIAKLF